MKSARRTVEVLEALAASERRITLAELHEALRIPKSSLHGILQTLVRCGWVEEDARGKSYRVGLRALRPGAAYLDRDPVIRAAGMLLAELGRALNETVHVARLDGQDVVYLATWESYHYTRVTSRIGRRLPAHATALGKSLLAARPWDEVDALLPATLRALTPDTVTDRIRLRKELDEIRVRGWAFEHGQNTAGLECFAVNVPSEEPPVDALSCAVPAGRVTDERRRTEIVGHLIDRAGVLSQLALQLPGSGQAA